MSFTFPDTIWSLIPKAVGDACRAISHWPRICVLGIGLLLAGCAANPTDSLPPEGVVTGSGWTLGDPFPQREARALFRAAVRAIDDRYIDPVDLEAFSFAAIRGLETVQPKLHLERNGNDLVLRMEGQPPQTLSAPIGQDGAAWGEFIANATEEATTTDVDGLGKTNPGKLYKAVFNAGFAHLDPFSRYASPHEARLNRSSRTGFGGVGITFEIRPSGVEIVRMIDQSPAASGGIEPGDLIVSIDGRPMDTSVTRAQVREWLQGPKGSSVTLDIRKVATGERRNVTLRRSQIVMPTVTMRLDKGVVFLTVASFNQSTSNNVAIAIDKGRYELQTRGEPFRGLVLDLRGNPGGLLDQAVALSDLFLNSGPIVSTRGRHPDARQFYQATQGDILKGAPIVVLIDGESASSAEIVAAALQDNGRAVVVGTASYGKGTVQTVIPMPNGGELFLTWSRYYSPSGYVPHGLGVLPVVCTSNASEGTSPDALISDASLHADDQRTESALWRASDPQNVVRRQALRKLCPAEHHGAGALDETVGARLLEQPPLYREFLQIDAPNGDVVMPASP